LARPRDPTTFRFVLSLPGRPFGLLTALPFLALMLAHCDSPPSASTLREWTPADHDRSEESARAAAGQQAPQSPGPKAAAAAGSKAPDMVLEETWAQQCAACHGPMGHGDGPTGPMVHARDLTLAEWQSSVTDEQIATVIMDGKGKMPSFASLPPKVIMGLVARIRASRGR
jgi:mono/diheme cytochrome c family protein